MKTILALLLAVALPAQAFAEVRLPHIFSDHMALQAGKPVPVWGWADPGEAVTLRFAGQTHTATADADGRWRLTLSPLKAGDAPSVMTVNDLTINDVIIGEVWLASGQSNMEKPLGESKEGKPTFDYEKELAAADHPDIRLFHIKSAHPDTPQSDVDGQWVRCDPASLAASDFSAAAYYFGRKLNAELKTPVGLIESTVGGTRIELWTAPEGFAAVPSLSAFSEAEKTPGAKVDGVISVSTLYNGMIAPITGYAIRGLIWYQGESNVLDISDGDGYADKMTALVEGWRTVWHDDFPVYYAQIAPHLYSVVRAARVKSPEAEPELWEAQTAALRLPKTGMIVTTDLVDNLRDIHPRDKKTVGERLADLALNKTYGRIDLPVSGPMLSTLTIAGNRAVVAFDYANGLRSRDGQPLSWFTIAGADGAFHPAAAVIDGTRITVSSPDVSHPTVVRFAWSEAAQPNLVNAANLPAAPFRTDNPFLAKH